MQVISIQVNTTLSQFEPTSGVQRPETRISMVDINDEVPHSLECLTNQIGPIFNTAHEFTSMYEVPSPVNPIVINIIDTEVAIRSQPPRLYGAQVDTLDYSRRDFSRNIPTRVIDTTCGGLFTYIAQMPVPAPRSRIFYDWGQSKDTVWLLYIEPEESPLVSEIVHLKPGSIRGDCYVSLQLSRDRRCCIPQIHAALLQFVVWLPARVEA